MYYNATIPRKGPINQLLSEKIQEEQSGCVQWKGRKITYCISCALLTTGIGGCAFGLIPWATAFFQINQLPGWIMELCGGVMGSVSCVGGLYLCCCKSDDNTGELIEALNEYKTLSDENSNLTKDLEELKNRYETLQDNSNELDNTLSRLKEKVTSLVEKKTSTEKSIPVSKEKSSWWPFSFTYGDYRSQ